MDPIAEQEAERPGEIYGVSCHEHDLVREMRDRLDLLWRYGDCIIDAEGEPETQQIWRDLQREELACIRWLKQVIVSRMEKGEFFVGL